MRLFIRIFAFLGLVACATAVILGGLAEFTSRHLDRGPFLSRNFERAMTWLKPVDPAQFSAESGSGGKHCLRYGRHPEDLRCGDIVDRTDQMLCRLTVPQATPVCLQFDPPG